MTFGLSCENIEAAGTAHEKRMNEREWQRLQNSMQFVIEQQVKFEGNFARIEANFDRANVRFIRAEKRLDRLERLGERMMKAADVRFKRSEARLDRLEENLDRLEENLTRLQGTVRDFVASLRAERRGNGRGGLRNH
jgi:chromosome segregation ATPase